MNLFQDNLVYPNDDTGSYVELYGKVVETEEFLGRINVEVDGIVYTGYNSFYEKHPEDHMPKIGYYAKIKIYRCGGGFYRDNRITGWSKEKYEEIL